MQLIRRSLSLVLACLVLLWAGASFADDTQVLASELAEHVQGADPLTQIGLDMDSPEVPELPVLASSPPRSLQPQPEVRPVAAVPALQSIYPPAASPPPRRA